MDLYTVKVTAKKLSRRKMLFKIATVITTISISVLLLFYGFVNFADNIGNFTVSVAKDSGSGTITLSNDPSFSDPKTILHADPIEEMTNIAEEWLPDDIDNIDGSHNGDNYIAYTFYLRNMGNSPINYKTEISIQGVTKNADEAVRVKVYQNGSATTYAKLAKDGSKEPDTTPFSSTTQVLNYETTGLLAGKYDKFTVVIWLEGNDPDCINDIMGGKIRLYMEFTALPYKNNDN